MREDAEKPENRAYIWPVYEKAEVTQYAVTYGFNS